MKKILLAISAIMLSLALTSCGDGMVSAPNNSSYYFGRNYESVVRELDKAGFTNIEATEISDLTSNSSMQDGGVESITIDGLSVFSDKDKFSPELPVKITYHIIPKIDSPMSSDEAQQLDYAEIEKQFKKAGFSDISYEELYDLDPDTAESDSKMEITVNGSNWFSKSNPFPFDSKVKVIQHYTYSKYNLKVKINFIPNWIFSKYDVNFYVDSEKQATLAHGVDGEYIIRLEEGEHDLKFTNSDNESIYGKTTLNVTSDIEASYKISCYSDGINIDKVFIDYERELTDSEIKIMNTESYYWGENYTQIVTEFENLGFTNIKTKPVYDIIWGITEKGSVDDVKIGGNDDFKRGDIFSKDTEIIITYHMPYEDDPSTKNTTTTTTTTTTKTPTDTSSQTTAPQSQYTPPATTKSSSVYYSTNSKSTVKNGDSGVYAYKSRGGTYSIYLIIDFDDGYVYRFTDGNGESYCDKVKIDEGNLNDVVIITYHDGEDEWSNGLHFNWKDQPDHLILEDNFHNEYDFYPTDLDDALKLRTTKTITTY